MFTELRGRLTYANVTSSLALFLALGGGAAYAANEWTGANIRNETLTGADVRGKPATSSTALVEGTLTGHDIRGSAGVNGSISGVDVASNTLTADDVRNNSLTADDIFDGTLTGTDVRDNSLTAGDVSNGTLTGTDVRDNSLTADDIDESTIPLPAFALIEPDGTVADNSGHNMPTPYKPASTTGVYCFNFEGSTGVRNAQATPAGSYSGQNVVNVIATPQGGNPVGCQAGDDVRVQVRNLAGAFVDDRFYIQVIR